MAKKPKISSTFRLSELTRVQIKYLSEQFQRSEAEVVELAVGQLALVWARNTQDKKTPLDEKDKERAFNVGIL